MPCLRLPKFRFRVGTLMALFLGLAIGLSINPQVLKSLLAPPTETNMRSHPTYRIEPPDILALSAKNADGSPLEGPISLQVGPDGFVTLGSYGTVYVAGMTIAEAQRALASQVGKQAPDAKITVDVFAYNSQKFYIIVESPPKKDYVVVAPINGNETVLDAVMLIGGIDRSPDVTTTIHVARPSFTGKEKILPVDFDAIARHGRTDTNYQLWPGDRLLISSTRVPAAARTENDKPDVVVTSFEEEVTDGFP